MVTLKQIRHLNSKQEKEKLSRYWCHKINMFNKVKMYTVTLLHTVLLMLIYFMGTYRCLAGNNLIQVSTNDGLEN